MNPSLTHTLIRCSICSDLYVGLMHLGYGPVMTWIREFARDICVCHSAVEACTLEGTDLLKLVSKNFHEFAKLEQTVFAQT